MHKKILLTFRKVKLDDGQKSSNSHKNWHENTFKACTTWFSSHFPTHSGFFFLYITCLQMGKSIPNWQFQAIKIQRDLRS